MAKRPIVSAPHQQLRQQALPVEAVTDEVITFIADLEETLYTKTKPAGVGLAAPQISTQWRIFTVQEFDESASGRAADEPIRRLTLINPHITRRGEIIVPQPDEWLEGCLSIPKLYGVVPRHEWVTLEYQLLEPQTGRLVPRSEQFDGFMSAVIQHELDHLDGVLFTDYSLEYDLPVYEMNPKTDRLEPLKNRSILEVL